MNAVTWTLWNVFQQAYTDANTITRLAMMDIVTEEIRFKVYNDFNAAAIETYYI